MILADMLDERLKRTVSVACRILDLSADLAETLAFPSHSTWREMPDRVARHAGRVEVGLQVADWTAHRREPKSVSAALDRWLVESGRVALTRAVARGVAVQTARMRQHLAKFSEHRRRSRRLIADRRKTLDAREIGRRRVGNGVRSQHACRQNQRRNAERKA